MNKQVRGHRRPRLAAVLAGPAAIALLATACGRSSASPASASPPTYAQELVLAQCMRAHGVPDFPDPRSSGGYSLNPSGAVEGADGGSVNINSSQVQAAYGHCRHLLPGGPTISQLEQKVQEAQQREEQDLPLLVKFSQCMRGHGLPSFPDLGSGSSQSSPPPGSGAGLNPKSPQFTAALRACNHLLPPGAHLTFHASSKSRRS